MGVARGRSAGILAIIIAMLRSMPAHVRPETPVKVGSGVAVGGAFSAADDSTVRIIAKMPVLGHVSRVLPMYYMIEFLTQIRDS